MDGIPCTTVARTLVDLGDVVPRRAVEKAVEQAEILQLFDLNAVERAIERAGPRRGAGILLSVLEELSGPTLTASDLEEAFLALCRDAGLRTPEVNVWMTLSDGSAIKVDFLWRRERLVVETDGHPFHRTRQSRERDTRRDVLLRLDGFEPVRFTGRQVVFDFHSDRYAMAAMFGAALLVTVLIEWLAQKRIQRAVLAGRGTEVRAVFPLAEAAGAP